jgi:polyhydroxyalkanoate synthesis regulator phasin
MIINDLVKKAVSTGLSIAVFAGEKLHSTMGDIIEKSKTIQERYNTAEDEEEADESEENEAEAINDEAEDAEPKTTRWEEYEHKLRRLVDSAISKFNFIRNDDHQRMEERITILEEKLSYIAKLVAEQNEEQA